MRFFFGSLPHVRIRVLRWRSDGVQYRREQVAHRFVHYRKQIVYIKRIGAHEEYDKWDL
jgi:mRNA-degrading endonuclease HigB of HigAB toxin-antitoxin module